MSVKTEAASAGSALRERAADAKRDVKTEAVTQLANAAMADGVGDHLSNQIEDARDLSVAGAGDEYLEDHEVARRHQKRERGLIARAGQNVDLVGLAIALVVVGVVMYVGLNVMSTTEQSTELDSNSEFQNASQDLTGGIADAYSLSGILFLVLILTGVVGLLLGLRTRR